MTRVEASNFTQFVTTTSLTLVLFSTPNCPHEPTDLRPTIAAVPSAALCEDKQLAETAGVRSFPALRIYSRGDNPDNPDDPPHVQPYPYRGPLHSPAAIMSYLRRWESSTPLVANSAREVRDEVELVKQTAILFAEQNSPAARMFSALSANDQLLRLQVRHVAQPGIVR